MPSKQVLRLIVAAAFAIALTVTPVPEGWKLPVSLFGWLVFLVAGGFYLLQREGSPLSPLSVFEAASVRLKEPRNDITTFQALYVAGAAELSRNKDVVWVCDKLAENEHEHPFVGLEKCVLQREWLEFLKWGKHHPKYHFELTAEYIDAAKEWGKNHGRMNCVSAKIAILGEIMRDQEKPSQT